MKFLLEIIEGVRIALSALRANKMRSALATIGIVIGIVTVTLMSMAIDGINGAFKESISSLGSDVLYVQKRDWLVGPRQAWDQIAKRRQITWSQYEAVRREMTLAQAIAPTAGGMFPVRHKNRIARSVMVIGANEQFPAINGLNMRDGRFFSASEADGGRPVAVIGYQIATNLFGWESPLGQKIKIGNTTLEVIGVVDQMGTFLGMFSWDNRVIMPVRLFSSSYRVWPDYEILVKVASLDKMEEARDELRGIMRRARGVRVGQADDFGINQQDMFLKTFETVSGTVATAGLLITGLSLFVGGIGIMNIMFVSVTERTREIGIRKAVGAKRRAILVQFLLEAAAICLLGGLIGLALASGAMLGLRQFVPVTLSLKTVALALGVAFTTGVVSGFLPAWRAGRLSPVDALRSE